MGEVELGRGDGELLVDEEPSADAETTHDRGNVGYWVLGGEGAIRGAGLL